MTDQIKLIVREVNSALNTKYDLIKFDALNEKQLLQLLADVLVHLGAGEKLSISEDDPELVSVQLLEMLSNVKYRPSGDVEPARFRGLLLSGDSYTVHQALLWLLTNKEQVKNTAYLARYLKLPAIPTDFSRNNTIQDLLDSYQELIEEFKEVHKRTRLLQKENSSEIISDIKEMAVERDIVIKRLENVQANFVDVSEKENLLSTSRALRVQQDKEKEFNFQFETQQSQLNMASEQLKRYLNMIHGQTATPKTTNDVFKHLQEEIQLNTYLVKEKYPSEISSLQKDINILQAVASEHHPARSDLILLQDKVGKVNNEIEDLVQRRLSDVGSQDDKLAPFRQQAALIRRNKEASAAKVSELSETLKESEAMLADLQSQVHQLLGDAVLRGEELKKYVNALRIKSTLYKRQRATLSAFKVEAGILNRTLFIISASDPTVEMALLNHKKLKIDGDETDEERKDVDLASRSTNELGQLVEQTLQNLSAVRHEIQPLNDLIKPIKEEFQNTQQQYEQKKRVYDATSINIKSQMEPIQTKVDQMKQNLNKIQEEKKKIKENIAKMESLQEIVKIEMRNSMQSPRKTSKIDELKKKVEGLEAHVKELEKEQMAIGSRQAFVEEQTQMWENTLKLLSCKMKARLDNKDQGKMHITQHSQMLTLT